MKDILIDLTGLLGLCSLAYGCWLFEPPLAFIVTGILLMIFAYKAAPAPTQKKKVE
ncbi:hypothetical protein [Sansalvadorimonas verongulae]|uniref:hypothetical protein n=1 Tax=Sansalvadorimonas verongulae TaxID=2172824 RepID=UPI0012BD2B3A|nr:hypothetical protein [Sansalvadorimonas verongulae]